MINNFVNVNNNKYDYQQESDTNTIPGVESARIKLQNHQNPNGSDECAKYKY